MDLMSWSARDLSNKCLEAFQLCLTFRSTISGLSNQRTSQDERVEYRLADFNLWIDGIGALAPSKASLDSRLSERQIDLSLVKGNLIMLFQSLEDCLSLLKENESLEEALRGIDSALESLVTLSLAIRRTGRRSRLHKADRLFKPEEHAELRKHLEAIILIRPGPGPCYTDDEFRKKMNSLTPLQSHLVTANLKRRNRFIQAHLHSLGLKKRSVGFELLTPEALDEAKTPTSSSEDKAREITAPVFTHTSFHPSKPLPAPMSVTSASVPESKLEYKEPATKKTESTPMTVITQITASARYPRPRVSDNEQKLVQCPCCCQTLPVSEAKNNNRWRKHLAEDIRPYTCIFTRCPTPDVYYSCRSMLEQHFRQDHPPVWVCPLCDEGKVYSTMTEMMDHLHNIHAQAIGEDISMIISSSAQMRMGIESCPLCQVKGDADSPELIDHVLEHVHDFSLRSLPWPKSSEVDLGGEVGSFNSESDGAAAVTQWLEEYERETGDIDPCLKLSTCDYGRLATIREQIKSRKEDKLGLDICFADEHGDESAEAETNISQLTQDTLESVNGPEEHDVVEPEDDPLNIAHRAPRSVSPGPHTSNSDLVGVGKDGGYVKDDEASKPSTRESISGFLRLTDRLFSRKKADNIEPQDDQTVDNILDQYPALNEKTYSILVKLYQRRLDSFIKGKSTSAYFIKVIQGQDIPPTDYSVHSLNSFLQLMISRFMDPLKPLPPKDLKYPISSYFINSSHRTLRHETSTNCRNPSDLIREALFAGYRSIDIDVRDCRSVTDTEERDLGVSYQSPKDRSEQTTKTFNRLVGHAKEPTASKPVAPKLTLSNMDGSSSRTEPIVIDDLALMTPVGFREACRVIRESAFINSDLPVVINISVHASPDQQRIMVRVMKKEWDGCLIDEPLEDCDPRLWLPRLVDLRGRILVTISAAASEGDDNERHIRIIKPLAKLGVYMTSEPFEGFDTPQTKSPTHVFSLPENQVQELISFSHTDLFRHNQNYFFRVNPNPARLNSSNLNPLKFWRHGFQMAAVSRGNVDEGMMLNEGMFADESGWVLKPSHSFYKTIGTPGDSESQPRLIELSVFVFKGQTFKLIRKDGIKERTRDLSQLTNATLYRSGESQQPLLADDKPTEDEESGALGYKHQFVSTTINNDIIPELSILRLKFADYPSGEGLIAWTSLRLDRLNQGYRLVPLYDDKGGLLSQQKMLIKFNIIIWK